MILKRQSSRFYAFIILIPLAVLALHWHPAIAYWNSPTAYLVDDACCIRLSDEEIAAARSHDHRKKREAMRKCFPFRFGGTKSVAIVCRLDIAGVILARANSETVDSELRQTIRKTRSSLKPGQLDYVDHFLAIFESMAAPTGKRLGDYFFVAESRRTTDSVVVRHLRQHVVGALQQTADCIEKRLRRWAAESGFRFTLQSLGPGLLAVRIPLEAYDLYPVRRLLTQTGDVNLHRPAGRQVDLIRAFSSIDDRLAADSSQH